MSAAVPRRARLLAPALAILVGALLILVFWWFGVVIGGEPFGTALGMLSGALFLIPGAIALLVALAANGRDRRAEAEGRPVSAERLADAAASGAGIRRGRSTGPLSAQLFGALGLGRPGRFLAALMPWLLAAALLFSVEPRIMIASVFLVFIGTGLGRLLYRLRPGALWARALVTIGIPLLFTALLLPVTIEPGYWPNAFAIPVGAEIGAALGRARERSTSAPGRVLARDWAGVELVGDPARTHFDIRPLIRQIPRAEGRAYAAADPAVAASGAAATGSAFVSIVAAIFPIGIIALVFGMTEQALSGKDDTASQLLGMSAALALMLLGGGILVWWSVRSRARITRPVDHLAYAQFAAVNGLIYDPKPGVSPDGEDVLTRKLHAEGIRNRVLVANREAVDANAVGDGFTHFGGLCAVQLATELPNIRLRARGNRLPAFSAYAAPARDQHLSLEGDFDRYFELYAPKGYERDALYLFTPDVMAWLIDDARGYDVELRGREVVFRSRQDQVTRDPADWQRLAHAFTALEERIEQWERWRDDRLDQPTARAGELTMERRGPAGRVGESGRRLRFGVGAGTIFVAGFVAIYVTLTVLANSI
ncbi:hypothetical protein JD292_08690 [Leucobacter sp. CSA2]|uniref:Uncharacterized protein n=1 Tax=Leucobacter edaphi TaxID=2796472 RepID=A0A934UXY6_9MICO|nr:hypothetical protein [Leucobacter edaphi]MBK0422151.1 hypothetical protein [Leucobacter edaphi]